MRLALCTLFCAALFGDPQIIDFGPIPYCDPFKECDWSHSFNDAPELIVFFDQIKSQCGIVTVVETGSCEGTTATFFSLMFQDVHTIEIDYLQYHRAKLNLVSFPNAHCYLGSSDFILPLLLPKLKDQALLFYLDAHWQEHWPLLNELETIGHTHKDNCVVVIDDFKVPGRNDILFDSYGDKECSLEYIQEKLKSIFTEYDSFYLIPKWLNSRAKFVALPKKWAFRFIETESNSK